MTTLDMIAAVLAAGAIGAYACRLRTMSWRTHQARCVAAQAVGAVVAAGGMYAAGGGLTEAAWACVAAAWLHLALTAPRWQSGPPPESRSIPDGVWHG
ncbi:MAG: hypothetical protein ACRCTX_18235 [Afipia sp.]